MCGIAGYMSRRGREVAPDVLVAMSERLRHRGPDGEGVWRSGPFHLAHRRLSIIDVAGGAQPLADPDERAVVVFNGEIYNYVELRQELAGRHALRTRSDTEVLLRLYLEAGPSMLSRLNGMFAFAIADRGRRCLFLARDRIGKKPLFYYLDDDWLVFASEVKGLLAHPAVPRRVDSRGFVDYLSLNYVPGNRTMLDGVCRLPPGSWLAVHGGRVEQGRYWRPSAAAGASAARDDAAAVAELDALLEDSCRLRLRSDVPVGVFLSGGVDSSTVATAAVRQGKVSKAFTLAFDEESFSEEAAARRVAATLGLPLEVIKPDAAPDDVFERLVWHADDPLADSSSLPVYLLSERTARDVKVVLSGDGGDELFAGYVTYLATGLARRLRPWTPAPIARWVGKLLERLPTSERKVALSYKLQRFVRGLGFPPAAAHLSWNGTWCGEAKLALVSRDVAGAIRRDGDTYLRLAAGHGLELDRPSLRDLQRMDVEEYLVNDILAKCDRMSMAHGLEVRCPLLDHRIVEWALALPDDLKLARGRVTKHLLKRLMARSFPPDLVSRPKQGFSIPVHAWLRRRFRPLVEELLSRGRLGEVGLFDVEGVRRVVDLHMAGRRAYGFEIWGLMVFMAWFRNVFRDASPSGFGLPSMAKSVAHHS